MTAADRPAVKQTAFERLTREYLDHYFAAEPIEATEAGDHRFDDRLPDYSYKAVQAEIAALGSFRGRLKAIAPASLSRDDQQDRAILLNEIERRIFDLDTLRVWETNPLLYARVAGGGVRSLLSRDFAPYPDRLRAAIARMHAIPAFLQAGKANLLNPSLVRTETAKRQNQGAIQFFEKDIGVFLADAPPDLAAEAQQASADAAIALYDYQAFLDDELGLRSHGEFRLGERLFKRKLQLAFCDTVDADALYGQAMEEFGRVRDEISRLANGLHGEIYPSHVHGRETETVRQAIIREVFLAIAADRTSPENLLDACRGDVDSLLAFVRGADLLDLSDLPPLAVEWTPAFSQGVAVAGLDAPGPLDRAQRSFFYVAPVPADWLPQQTDSYLREYNLAMLRMLSIHEAVPGHYVQLVKANRHPSVVRSLFGNGPMIEGWAVYCERMTLDAGYGGGDPRLRLQQLKLYLRTVANAILDYRIHVMGISEKQAMDLLVKGAYQEESEARGKWTRARLGAVQLSTYFGGYQGIVALEAAYREKRGDAFSRKEFNEALLGWGSPPLWVLWENLMGEGAPVGKE